MCMAARRHGRSVNGKRLGPGKGWNPHAHGNAARGARAAERVKREYETRGWKVRPAGKGADWAARKGTRRILIEVKTGGGKLSRNQEAARRRVGRRNYVVAYRRTRRTKGAPWSAAGNKRHGRALRKSGGVVRRNGRRGSATWQ